MAIPQSFIEELKSRVEIEDLIGGYVKLRRQGSNLTGLCPFHSEKSPSFTVFVGSQSYYCFGCHAGGDAINFVRAVEHLDYVDAVKFLADRVGMTVPQEEGARENAAQRADILELNKTAARWFHEQLRKTPQAVRYLSGRGLSEKTILHFGLGYAPEGWDNLLRHLEQKGYTKPDVKRAGLAAVNQGGRYYDYFRGRIMFPIIDVRGNVVGFGGRVLDDSKPKYLNSPDTPVFKKSRSLFSLCNAKGTREGQLILAEGYLDVISLYQAGFAQAVATLGTALTSEQARLMNRYAKEVVIAYDMDEAGRRATQRASELLTAAGLKVRVLRLDGAKDPDEYLRTHGPERLRAQLSRTEGYVEYRLSQAAVGLDLQDAAGKVSYLKEAAAILARLDSPVERDVYAGRVAAQLGVEKDNLLTEANRLRKSDRKKAQQQDIVQQQRLLRSGVGRVDPDRARHLRASRAEEGILCLLYDHPDYYDELSKELSPDDFVTPFHRRVLVSMANAIEMGERPDLSGFREFSIEEIGVIQGILLGRERFSGTREELRELMETLQQERRRGAALQHGMDDEELRRYLQSMGQRK